MRFVLFCVSLFVLFGLSGKLGNFFGMSPGPVENARAAAPAPKQAAKGSTMMAVSRSRDGHFAVDAVIGGRQVNFLVDTGASLVTLTADQASRLGITTSARDRTVRMQTANGVAQAKMVRLAAVEIGSLLVQDVDAVVMPSGTLSQNLLGMSFLSRLRRYEFRSGQLVMEQ